MPNFKASLPFLACVALVACSDVYDVAYDYDDQFPIESIETFGWLPLTKKNRSRTDEITFRRVQAAVAADLTGKGLAVADDKPDVMIEVIFGAKSGSRRSGKRGRYRYKEGFLNLDFIDPKTDELIWHGEARAILDPESDPEGAQARISEAVGQILANFPPERSDST